PNGALVRRERRLGRGGRGTPLVLAFDPVEFERLLAPRVANADRLLPGKKIVDQVADQLRAPAAGEHRRLIVFGAEAEAEADELADVGSRAGESRSDLR